MPADDCMILNGFLPELQRECVRLIVQPAELLQDCPAGQLCRGFSGVCHIGSLSAW